MIGLFTPATWIADSAVIDSRQEGQALEHVAGYWVVAMQHIDLGEHSCIVAVTENEAT